MYGMTGACIGARSNDVGGSESCQCGSIEFAFSVRQKENVLGRPTDLLTDFAVAGGCLFLTYAGNEKCSSNDVTSPALVCAMRRLCACSEPDE